jgi:hypothetical protein
MHQSTHDNQNCNIRLSNSHTTLRVGTVCISVGFRLNALRTRTSKKMRPMLQRTLVQHSIDRHQNCSIRLSNSHSSVGEGTVQISWAFSFNEKATLPICRPFLGKVPYRSVSASVQCWHKPTHVFLRTWRHVIDPGWITCRSTPANFESKVCNKALFMFLTSITITEFTGFFAQCVL